MLKDLSLIMSVTKFKCPTFFDFFVWEKKKLISLTHYKLKRVNLFRSLNNQVDSPHSILQITSHTILFSTYKFDEIIEFNQKIRKISSYVEPDLADSPGVERSGLERPFSHRLV